MPIDLSPYTAGYVREPQKPHYSGGGTYEVQRDGLQDMLVRILEAQFPEVLAGAAGTLTNKPAGLGALMDFSPIGMEIRAQPRARYGNNFIIDRNKKGETTGVRGPDTNDVLENLAPLLHEFYHARAAQGPGDYRKGIKTEGREWQLLMDNAIAAGFPSMEHQFFSGGKVEEFLASATAIKSLQARGIPVEGRLKKAAANLPQLETLHPWLADYIEQWTAPEKMKPAEK